MVDNATLKYAEISKREAKEMREMSLSKRRLEAEKRCEQITRLAGEVAVLSEVFGAGDYDDIDHTFSIMVADASDAVDKLRSLEGREGGSAARLMARELDMPELVE